MFQGLNETCPCPVKPSRDVVDDFDMLGHVSRRLDEEDPGPETWETVVVGVTVFLMFVVMVSDKVGPDWVMLTGLMIFIVTDIITLSEGLKGFSNEGILTVMALFVVADGVSRTGALDYYMGKILGKPRNIAGAQIRLMVPIAIWSAFFNNTPIVAMMIPLTLRWAKANGFPKEQLLIPLSYATILGGTCTLVGTSTNIVVYGLLKEDYPDEPAGNIGLFELAIYGVPNAIIGLAYIMLASPFLLPKGTTGAAGNSETEDFLLGARVLPWSPAAGRTVKRSGLGDSAGVYLVNVRRAATGNVHLAVSRDFVISVGDDLYFTGSAEDFSAFCDKHGLELITAENIDTVSEYTANGTDEAPIEQSDDETERLHALNRLVDQINHREDVEPGPRPSRIVVTGDVQRTEGLVVVGVDCEDRPGLLSDISDGLFKQLSLQIKHSEAEVVSGRSLSVWRCEVIDGSDLPNYHDVFSVLSSLLPNTSTAITTGTTNKTSGKRVVRAHVTKTSALIGKTPATAKFSESYKAALVAYQKNNKNARLDEPFSEGDLLVLATQEDSPLLIEPPKGFYNKKPKQLNDEDYDLENHAIKKEVWSNLQVVFEHDSRKHSDQDLPKGEFLTALVVAPRSPYAGKSIFDTGISKLPGALLVSAERNPKDGGDAITISPDEKLQVGDILWFTGSAEAIGDIQKVRGLVFYQEKEILKASSDLTDRRLVQAVVARGSPLIGQTVITSRFRSEYGGAVVAIQRGSERIHEHPGTVVLHSGDVLLIEAGQSFAKHQANNYKVFALVAEVKDSAPPRPRMFLVVLALVITSFALAAAEVEALIVTASLAAIVMVIIGVMTQQEARDALQWDLFVVIGAASGVGAAMTNSGVAEGLATFLVSIGKALNIGDAGVYGAVYLAGNLLSSVLTNNAAALLTYPIAMEAVDQTGADRLSMAFIVMLSASDYMTSFGYQTNLMVYGPGGYSNRDFMKLGSTMQIILWLSSTAMVATESRSNWFISWIVASILFIVVAVIRLCNGILRLGKAEEGKELNDTTKGSKDGTSWHFNLHSHPETVRKE